MRRGDQPPGEQAEEGHGAEHAAHRTGDSGPGTCRHGALVDVDVKAPHLPEPVGAEADHVRFGGVADVHCQRAPAHAGRLDHRDLDDVVVLHADLGRTEQPLGEATLEDEPLLVEMYDSCPRVHAQIVAGSAAGGGRTWANHSTGGAEVVISAQ